MFGVKGFAFFLTCAFHLLVNLSHGSEIIGGQEVKPHSLPYMAYVIPGCGGTLIDPQWVLTAAHCENVTAVVFGVHSIKKKETKSRQVHTKFKEILHPKFNKKTKDNDLMLIKLKKPVDKTKTVQWFPLKKTISDPAAGTKCLVAGWGRTNGTSNKTSDVLRSANVFVVKRKECNTNHTTDITSNMVCAGSKGKKSTDTCQGDSGGPLVCKGRLVGVTSFGEECGDPDVPGVYAFLTEENLKWIRDKMKKSDV